MSSRPPVAVALSGGVDSSLAAALLLEAGREVVGLTMDLGSDEPVERAGAVARHLGIPLHVVDCRQAFEDSVLRPAWQEYERGRTPSPCVLCNPRMKFGVLAARARDLGAAELATGHHALRLDGPEGPVLARGRDRRKDQSYFLAGLSREQLAASLFPVGALTKAEVRARAEAIGLPSARAAESQDLCVASASLDGQALSEGLRRRFGKPARPGLLLGPDGAVVGRHEGLHLFTVGQRRGVRVALGRRAWVASIDGASAEVRLATDREALLASGLVAVEATWHGRPPAPGETLRCRAQIRYRHAAAEARATVDDGGGRIEVRFDRPQSAVAPGQALVLYDDDRVLACGWIEGARRRERRVTCGGGGR
jgi:tRNA-specific 2-thiouridylase